MRAPASLLAVGALCLLAGCGGSTTTSGLPNRPPKAALVQQAALQSCPPTPGGKVEGGLPTVTLPCFVGGGPVHLAGIRGPAIVNIWASDCGPCQQEAPALEWLAQRAKGRLLVLGVDDEPQPNLAMHFAKDFGLHYPMVYDEHGVTDAALHVIGIPASFFVDAHGRIVGAPYLRPLPTGDKLLAMVRQRLGVDLS